MQLVISGVHVDVGDALRQHVESSIEAFNERHGLSPVEVIVRISKEVVYQFRIDISYHMGRGLIIRGHGEGQDAHFCLETALHMLAELIHRQKRRLVAHHKQAGERLHPTAPYYVLAAEEPDSSTSGQDLAPPVIAELTEEIPTLTVSEAVMRLDLSQQPAMMFYNQGHGRLNMVYRRLDGNIGWVDPPEVSN